MEKEKDSRHLINLQELLQLSIYAIHLPNWELISKQQSGCLAKTEQSPLFDPMVLLNIMHLKVLPGKSF